MKNAIFQYMIIGPECDERGPVPQWPHESRSALYKKTADLSALSFKKYAEKIDAFHHYSEKKVFTKDKTGPTVLLFELLRIIYDPLYEQFDNVLFCDTDIICDTEENIFDVHVASGKEVSGITESDILVGANPDECLKGNGKSGYASWDHDDNKLQELVDKYGRLEIPVRTGEEMGTRHPSKVFIMNTGVHVWTKDARMRARECFDDWYTYMMDGVKHNNPFWLNNDQPYISGMLAKYGFEINHLEQTWNDTPTHYHDGYPCWKGKSKFLHYTGGQGKAKMLELREEGQFNYV